MVAAGILPRTRTAAQESAAAKPVQAAVVKAVKFGKLWDGKGKVWTNAIVIVDGERVREVTTDAKKIPAGAAVIDLSKYYGLPGLIDVHTHVTMNPDFDPFREVTSTSAKEAINGVVNARKTLMAGFTSIRNVGAGGFVDVDLRDAINNGEVAGPHMLVVRTYG